MHPLFLVILVFAPAAAVLVGFVVLGATLEYAAVGAVVLGVAGIVALSRHERATRAALERDAAQARQEAESARRELEASVSGDLAVFDALPIPLLMIGAERRIRRANPAAEEILEQGTGGTLTGRDLSALMRNPELLEAVEEVLGGAEGRVVEFARAGPVARYFSARVARLPGAGRDGAAAILAVHDLTALKRAEQLRADFVANASHELRTPLASLLGFIETLRGPAREDAEARQRFLAVMQEQGRRMARLVEDLLSLSRIELLEHSPPRGSADLAGLARAVAKTLQPQAKARDMSFELELEDLPAVTGDGDELAQVLQNLLDNAIKYGRAGTLIRVSGRRLAADSAGARRLGRPGVALSVVDRGEGIARAHLPRLTERFYRVDTGRSRKLGGTGLGLAIVKHILNRHRGHLEIDSTPGQGSSFTVLLPIAEP